MSTTVLELVSSIEICGLGCSLGAAEMYERLVWAAAERESRHLFGLGFLGGFHMKVFVVWMSNFEYIHLSIDLTNGICF